MPIKEDATIGFNIETSLKEFSPNYIADVIRVKIDIMFEPIAVDTSELKQGYVFEDDDTVIEEQIERSPFPYYSEEHW